MLKDYSPVAANIKLYADLRGVTEPGNIAVHDKVPQTLCEIVFALQLAKGFSLYAVQHFTPLVGQQFEKHVVVQTASPICSPSTSSVNKRYLIDFLGVL